MNTSIENLDSIAKNLRKEIAVMRQEKLEGRLEYDPVEAVARGMAERMALDWDRDWGDDCEFPDKYDFLEMARAAIRILAGGGVAPWSEDAWRLSPPRFRKAIKDGETSGDEENT
jgi:hypothetical protein